ncbi:hydantoinase/oxoprolinase family protein [Ancylobacter terrae]|uniref:hydantoinase/oxoprolinase family protein n=1 Tax=Ancylobacter sp. sgz301288 TaxID=3342077 RepID=UPI00385D91BD
MGTSVRIGVDIGGTFTDLVLIGADGRTAFLKTSSTPESPERAVVTGIAAILDAAGVAAADVAEVVHGTTVGSNTLLQKVGARCGLITTRGFRDVLEIGRVRTPGMFDLAWRKPEPLVPRRWRLEVTERIGARGEIVTPLAEEDVRQAGAELVAAGVESVAVCFLNSYLNPTHEERAAAVLRAAFPDLAVTASVAVLPSMGEYERSSTTAVNAYVLPVLRGYIARLETALRELGIAAPLLIGNSNGGLSTAAMAREKPVFFVSSGRASGAVGAARLGDAIDMPDLIAFDMGGTTASATLVQAGDVSRTHEYEFRDGISTPSRLIKAGGYMMRVPTVDVAEVGSGAGSIATIDGGGLLCVGPRSAGAFPGPACYRQGGVHATVTDANLALGLLPPALGGGALTLDVAASRAALTRDLGVPLGLGVEDAAWGIREVANTNMARAIRAVTVERGVDPRDFTLVAFGGSGPAHACDLAAMLGMRRVLFPPAPGVFTAAGMLAGSLEHHFLRPFAGSLSALDAAALKATSAAMGQEARAAFAADAYPVDDLVHRFALDLRFEGQEAAIPVPFTPGAGPAELADDFRAAYRTLYGYVAQDRIETVAIRLVAQAPLRAAFDFRTTRLAPPASAAAQETARRAYFGRARGWIDVPVLPRSAFTGERAGPLVLESADSTLIVPPGFTAAAGPAGTILATHEEPRR